MNKKICVCLAALLATSGVQVWGQSETLAVGIAAQQESRGSARYQALSGALGAVGADFSSVHQNPAGIALFRTGSKLSLTGAYTGALGRSMWGGNTFSERNNLYTVDEMSYMNSWTTGSGMSFTFGFGIQNGGRLRRTLDASRSLSHEKGFSLADYAAAVLNGGDPFVEKGEIMSKGFNSRAPWIGVLAHEAGWVDFDDKDKVYGSAFAFDDKDGRGLLNEGPRSVGLRMEESGSLTHYDIAFGFRPSSLFSLGMVLTISDLDYSIYSSYSEGFRKRQQFNDTYGLSLDNTMDVHGGGVRFALGMLLEPIDGLRLGASVYTPMAYSLKIDHWSRATGVSPSFADKKGAFDVKTPTSAANAFGLRTPWRFGLSGAYVLGRRAIFSADYEYSTLSGTRLYAVYDEGYDGGDDTYKMDNDAIKSDFGGSGRHTLRLGVEVNATNRLALRGGYRLTTAQGIDAALSSEVPKIEALVPGTLVHYRLPGAINSYSLGLGYRLSPSWTLDVAYMHHRQSNMVQPFPFIIDQRIYNDKGEKTAINPVPRIDEEQLRNQVAVTLNYRF